MAVLSAAGTVAQNGAANGGARLHKVTRPLDETNQSLVGSSTGPSVLKVQKHTRALSIKG